MNHTEIATQIKKLDENIVLIYAFNGTGKTRLSVSYKDISKDSESGAHTGVYYNAFSEDLFVWDNDEDNDNAGIKLNINYSSLNAFHSFLDIINIEEKLALYHPKYKFRFNLYDDLERGIESITFYVDEELETPIKISRGEERIFVWCFFLALFDVDSLANEHDAHFFIDDPVSSLDDHNIFITAESIYNIIEDNYLKKRIIITTHHIGLFSILFDKLKKGQKSGRYNKLTKPYILNIKEGDLNLSSLRNDVFLFHLHLLQTLDEAKESELFAYHFVLLRQLLENISSFLGRGGIGFTLKEIGIENDEETGSLINSLSHKNAYRLQYNKMSPTEEEIFKDIFEKINTKYKFKY
ncbi:MAG: AAA family ATPase [Bacteroidetes bacterium]|nr:AAA family ATPase [Bacteroidota bacterium]